LCRAAGVRGDAPVALLADRDGQRDQLADLRLELTTLRGDRRGVLSGVGGVDLGDRLPQCSARSGDLVQNFMCCFHDHLR